MVDPCSSEVVDASALNRRVTGNSPSRKPVAVGERDARQLHVVASRFGSLGFEFERHRACKCRPVARGNGDSAVIARAHAGLCRRAWWHETRVTHRAERARVGPRVSSSIDSSIELLTRAPSPATFGSIDRLQLTRGRRGGSLAPSVSVELSRVMRVARGRRDEPRAVAQKSPGRGRSPRQFR